jgi:Tol biopolymer transport system component
VIAPIWSPEGARLLFSSNRKGRFDLYEKPASGAEPERVVLESDQDKVAGSWSSDGRFVLYSVVIANPDIWVLPMSGDRKPFPYLQTKFGETAARFSPDGRWVADQSNESGRRNEVYVAPFPGPGGKRIVSTAGGIQPRWSHDGSEIIYATAFTGTLMAAAVNGRGPTFEVGVVKPLFKVSAGGAGSFYDVAADGRFLVNSAVVDQPVTITPLTVVVNWLASVKK